MKWRVWECVDCDPEFGESKWDTKYKIAHEIPDDSSWERSPDIDFCPRCESRLSWSIGEDVEITNKFGRVV